MRRSFTNFNNEDIE